MQLYVQVHLKTSQMNIQCNHLQLLRDMKKMVPGHGHQLLVIRMMVQSIHSALILKEQELVHVICSFTMDIYTSVSIRILKLHQKSYYSRRTSNSQLRTLNSPLTFTAWTKMKILNSLLVMLQKCSLMAVYLVLLQDLISMKIHTSGSLQNIRVMHTLVCLTLAACQNQLVS